MAVTVIATPQERQVRAVRIPAYVATLPAELVLPPQPRGLVVFARITGRPRISVRDRLDAAAFQDGGFATLVFDLLTPEEEMADGETRLLQFDIAFLARRLLDVVDWAAGEMTTAELPLVLYGEGTGAAAALVVASRRAHVVRAVVSHRGRPDLASAALSGVKAPTLLIADGHDAGAVGRTEIAFNRLVGSHELTLVEGTLADASHGFNEAARLALEWFDR